MFQALLLYPLADNFVGDVLLHVTLTVLPEPSSPACASVIYASRVFTLSPASVAVILTESS